MAELIEREAILKHEVESDRLKGVFLVVPKGYILDAPTVDAVTVVRCGDCRHSSKIANSTKGERHCWSLRGRNNGDGFSRVNGDGYCDEGERMDADAPGRVKWPK